MGGRRGGRVSVLSDLSGFESAICFVTEPVSYELVAWFKGLSVVWLTGSLSDPVSCVGKLINL